MTQTRTGSCTWLAAIPAPFASRIVSTRSSMSRCIGAAASSSCVTSRARSRRTGWPIVAILRRAMPEEDTRLALLRQDDGPRRLVAEEHARRRRAPAHLADLEAMLVQDLPELVQAVDAHRVLDLARPSV